MWRFTQLRIDPWRIISSNIHWISRIKRIPNMFIEPRRAVWGAFERVVGREHGGVGANLGEDAQQRGGREVAGGGDEDLNVKVVAHELVFAHGKRTRLSLWSMWQRSYGLEGNHQKITS